MPPKKHTGTSQDFAFQSTDQSSAHPFGGVQGALQEAFPAPQHDRHEAHLATDDPIAPTIPTQGSALENPLNYPYQHFAAFQNSVPAHFPTGSGISAGAPLVGNQEDAGNAVDFSSFLNYEPQGELVQEVQTQHAPGVDFSIPRPAPPVANFDEAFHSFLQIPPAQPPALQNPLSSSVGPPQQLSVQTGIKRKADSEPRSEARPSIKRPAKSRASSIASTTFPVVTPAVAAETRPPAALSASVTNILNSSPAAGLESPPQTNSKAQKRKEPSKGTVSTPRRIAEVPGAADILPPGKVFPIQIGSELFKLSGASISSDAPSYFSHFFGEQIRSSQGQVSDIRPLYIDRDPDTFRDIALHLQGYHISPRDEQHFVRLFADAQYYSLPGLTRRLFSADIFIRIGGVPFQIPRDLFSSPGDNPNYFTLGFASFFSTPSEVFPGLDHTALLRPPSIAPPCVPNRSGETFGELVKMLQGYSVDIRNDAHRSQLLGDARYFNFKGVEQRLIHCEKSYNLQRGQSEILVRLEDIRQSGVYFTPDTRASNSDSGAVSDAPSQLGVSPASSSKPTSPTDSLGGSQFRAGTVSYARPYTDDNRSTNILILELSSGESTKLHLPVDPPISTDASEPFTLNLRATFHGSTLWRITSLFSVIASRLGLPAAQPPFLTSMQSRDGFAAPPASPANSGVSEHHVRVRLSPDCYLEIDNAPAELAVDHKTGRVGLRRSGGERHYKRVKVSKNDAQLNEYTDSGLDEWIWGGARESEVAIRDGEELEETIVVKRAHWMIRVENVDGEAEKMVVVLCGVKIEGYSGQRARNQERGFLR